MTVKRKKLWIILTVVCCVFVTLGLVFGLAFRLKTVDIEFVRRESPSRLEANIADKVKEDGEFEFGKNILFMNFDESIAKIEKKNPYVKVNQVIKAFPNIVRVYILERVPQYRIRDGQNANKWYILDEDFKVLQIIEASDIKTSEFFDLTFEISPKTATIGGNTEPVGVGDFIKFNNDNAKYLGEISNGIFAVTKSSVSVFGVEIQKVGDDFDFVITMKSDVAIDGRGCKILIKGAEDLYKKTVCGISTFGQEVQDNVELNVNSKTITVEKTATGEFRGTLKNDE